MKFVNDSFRLPLTGAAGVSYSPMEKLTVAADLSHGLYSGETSLNIGSEFWAMGSVALRAGYNAPLNGSSPSSYKGLRGGNTSTLNALTGMGLGMGLKLANYQFDYALVPYGDLGATHRMSFTTKF